MDGNHDEHNTPVLVQALVSKTPLCSKKYTPKVPFKDFMTSVGIRLGSSKADIIRAYGNPDRVDDLRKPEPNCKECNELLKQEVQYGAYALNYLPPEAENSLLFSAFYIKQEKIQIILISISE